MFKRQRESTLNTAADYTLLQHFQLYKCNKDSYRVYTILTITTYHNITFNVGSALNLTIDTQRRCSLLELNYDTDVTNEYIL
jgi:hypothetical protein